jgi:outer membrane protein TolC
MEVFPIFKKKRKCFAVGVFIFLTIIISAFLFSYSVFCSEENKETAQGLSLKETILIAFANNKDIQIQEREISVARANILDARSKFLPQINLEGSYTRRDKVLSQNIFTGYYNDNKVGLLMNQSVYTGGENMANLKTAQLGLKVQEETLRAKKLDVEFDVKRLYYGLMLAYETERIARETLEQAKAHYQDVKDKLSEGTASRFDALQSEVQVSLLIPNLVKASNDINLIKAELNKVLSRKVDASVEVEEKLGYSHLETNEDRFLKAAYLNKPEMTLKALGVDINKWTIQMAKSGYRPQIDIGVDYSYRSNSLANIISSTRNNWNAGVSLNIPIFEGFSTKAKVDAAKARYSQAILDKENLADQIAVDIRRACLDLREAETIINSQKDNVGEAREALRIAEVRYDNGVGTNLDVLDAQVSLSQIQLNLANGIYDYLMAEAYLRRSLGESFIKVAAQPGSEAGNK